MSSFDDAARARAIGNRVNVPVVVVRLVASARRPARAFRRPRTFAMNSRFPPGTAAHTGGPAGPASLGAPRSTVTAHDQQMASRLPRAGQKHASPWPSRS